MINLNKILFLDIETVPLLECYSDLEEGIKGNWKKKCISSGWAVEGVSIDELTELYLDKSALYPEYSRICCVSFGYWKGGEIVTVSIIDEDEERILVKVKEFISNKNFNVLAAFNGMNFDFPYLSRRYFYKGLELPLKLRVFGKKPWEIIQFFDPMNVLKFSGFTACGLDIACVNCGISSPKTIMNGAEVKDYFWNGDHKLIEKYCEGDVIAMIQLVIRMLELNVI